MKTKRILPLLLALALSLSMAVPASATEPSDGDGNEGIELHMQLFEDPSISVWGTFRTDSFTSTPGNGGYIKVWYRNSSDKAATVYLYREGQSEPVGSVKVEPNSDPGVIRYTGSDTEAVSYYVRITAALNGPVRGYLAVAQKFNSTD